MSFESDIERFARKVEQRQRDIFIHATNEVQRSIVDGSELTGAPGQPVDTGDLRASWQPRFTGPWTWRTATDLIYARPIEEGIGPHGPIRLRSRVGGFHSVKLTRNGWPNIVDEATRKVVGSSL